MTKGKGQTTRRENQTKKYLMDPKPKNMFGHFSKGLDRVGIAMADLVVQRKKQVNQFKHICKDPVLEKNLLDQSAFGHECRQANHCEYGLDEKKSPFTIPWTVSGNMASAWYCSNRPVRHGSYWRLCERHWRECGEKPAWGKAKLAV